MDTVPNFFKRFYNLSTGGNKTNTPKLENRSRLFRKYDAKPRGPKARPR